MAQFLGFGRRIRSLIAALPLLAAAVPAAAQSQPSILTVLATGRVPGFASAEVPTYLSAHMADATVRDWQFEPVSADFRPPGNRVEWNFRLEQDASGGKDAGTPPWAEKRRFVARRLLLVEVRLYLDGEFQTVMSSQAEIYGGPQDEALAAFVQGMSERLLGADGAYRAIDLRPERSRESP